MPKRNKGHLIVTNHHEQIIIELFTLLTYFLLDETKQILWLIWICSFKLDGASYRILKIISDVRYSYVFPLIGVLCVVIIRI